MMLSGISHLRSIARTKICKNQIRNSLWSIQPISLSGFAREKSELSRINNLSQANFALNRLVFDLDGGVTQARIFVDVDFIGFKWRASENSNL